MHALDTGFAISDETATVSGEMEIKVVRPADAGGHQFWLTIRFPSGEELVVRIARSQLLQELDVEADEG